MSYVRPESLRSVGAYAQSGQSLCQSLENSMSFKLLTEYHLEFLSLKGGCTDSPESILVKIPHCWKSNVAAELYKFMKAHITANLKQIPGRSVSNSLRPEFFLLVDLRTLLL